MAAVAAAAGDFIAGAFGSGAAATAVAGEAAGAGLGATAAIGGASAAGLSASGALAAGWGALNTPFGAAAAGSAASKVLGPKAPAVPQVKPVMEMPDPLEQQKAKERSIIEQMARRGRSASILTSEGGGTLGGG